MRDASYTFRADRGSLVAMLANVPRWIKIGGAALAGIAILRPRVASAATPSPEPARPRAPAPVIRLGSTGPTVAWWRWRIGLAPAPATFDAATDTATRAWQAQRGLTADGVVGPATWSAAGIKGAPIPSQPAPSPGPAQPLPTPGPAPVPAPSPPSPPSPAPGPGNLFGLAGTIPAREAQILAFIDAGEFDHEWHPLTWTKNGRTVSALVSRRALALQRGDYRLPVSVTFRTAQAIADRIGGAMLTTRIADEAWRRADVRLAPITRPTSGMSGTPRMIEYGAAVEAAVGGRGGLVANEGKDWVLTRRNHTPPAGSGVEKPVGALGSRHNGANFGWYGAGASRSPGGQQVIQSIGLAHDMSHADYSQLVRFVKRDSITIDGVPVSYAAALADPALSALLQDEGGTLPSDRHPDL